MGKWEMVRLGDVFHQIRNGVSIKQGEVNGGYPITRIETISAGYIDRDKFGYAGIVTDKYSDYYLEDGDILMSHINSEKHLGKVAIYEKLYKEDKLIHGMNLLCLKTDKMFSVFAIYHFRSQLFKRQIPSITKKSVNQASFTITALKELKILKPPLHEQKRIAKNLDLASEIVKGYKEQLAELDKLIQSVFYEMFGDPVTNEKKRGRIRLGDICTINPKKNELCVDAEFVVSFIPMQAVSENGKISTQLTRSYGDVKTGFTYFRENDVLFAKITPCMENGKGAVAKGLMNGVGFGSTEFHVLRPKAGIAMSDWLFRLTHLSLFRRQAEKNMTGSAGQKRVPVQYLQNFKTSIPPLPLQTRFAEIVTAIEDQKTQAQQALIEAENLFNSLMQEYFA